MVMRTGLGQYMDMEMDKIKMNNYLLINYDYRCACPCRWVGGYEDGSGYEYVTEDGDGYLIGCGYNFVDGK